MRWLAAAPLLALAAQVGADASVQDAAAEDTGCTITANLCKNFPEFTRKQFHDAIGEEHLGAGNTDAACLKRAEDFHHWCGNGDASGAQVAATYNPSQVSQVYHPGACEKGWSQWDSFCYKHFWEKKTWFEAEAICRERKKSHLASIHSQAENRFIYTLTRGLSAWIGYTDIDQDTHYKWSDNTQDDFSNFAKNCTGREHEPDCKPEEKAQQWYDWEGHDKGTFVCKHNALLPVQLLKNVTTGTLALKPWSSLLPGLALGDASEEGVGGAAAALSGMGAPELKVSGIAPSASSGGAPAEAKATMPEPKLAAPKGLSFF